MFKSLLETILGDSFGVQERPDGIAFLKLAKSIYPLASVSYVAFNIPINDRARFMHCTYSEDWTKYCVSVAPICSSRLGDLNLALQETTDWRLLSDTATGQRLLRLAPDAQQCNALSFPLRPLVSEKALWCISSNASELEWAEQKDRLTEEFELLANYFHQHMMRLHGHRSNRTTSISRREIDCLELMAAGKTAAEASVILGISERTVRFHLNTVREKLNCLTPTQAVAKAVSQQLIAC